MSLVWKPLDKTAVQAWSELTNLLAVVDRTDEVYEPEHLAEELDEPGLDPELNTQGVWDDGRLIGYAELRVADALSEGQVRASLGGGVHPEYRGRGIGRAVMDFLEERALQLSAVKHPGVPVKLEASGGVEGDPVRPMLEHRGYQIVRYFHEMERPLPGDPLAEADHPVELLQPEMSEALRIAHNDAFSTHWGSVPQSEAQWEHGFASQTLRPDCSVVARAADGSIEAYTMSYCYVAGELYIGRVGTIQSARGRGLARACMLGALRAGLEHGYTKADLHVDSSNPTGAGALYESVGFSPTKTFAAYLKEMPAPV